MWVTYFIILAKMTIIYTLFTELMDDHGAVMKLQGCAWSMQTVTN